MLKYPVFFWLCFFIIIGDLRFPLWCLKNDIVFFKSQKIKICLVRLFYNSFSLTRCALKYPYPVVSLIQEILFLILFIIIELLYSVIEQHNFSFISVLSPSYVSRTNLMSLLRQYSSKNVLDMSFLFCLLTIPGPVWSSHIVIPVPLYWLFPQHLVVASNVSIYHQKTAVDSRGISIDNESTLFLSLSLSLSLFKFPVPIAIGWKLSRH